MKVVYIAHPISGNVEENVKKVKGILTQILDSFVNIWPVAPYLQTLELLDDDDPKQRELGMEVNKRMIQSVFIDELWVYGTNNFSKGVYQEIVWATQYGTPVKIME